LNKMGGREKLAKYWDPEDPSCQFHAGVSFCTLSAFPCNNGRDLANLPRLHRNKCHIFKFYRTSQAGTQVENDPDAYKGLMEITPT